MAMKRMAKVLVILVLALALCQSAMAAPTQGAYMAATHAKSVGMFDRFMQIFGAIWGGSHGAIWSSPGSNSIYGAIRGGGGGH